MRKYFILGKNAIARHISMSLIIILQAICILVGSNMLLASYNQQYLLIRPFEKWLNSDGFYVSSIGGIEGETGTSEEWREMISQLQGEWESVVYYREGNYTIAVDGRDYPLKVLVYDNDFWDRYTPVIKNGKRQKSNSSDENPWCIATPNIYNRSIKLPGATEKLEVKGLLGDLCYIPVSNQWIKDGSFSDNFYKKYSTARDDDIYILMPESQWNKLRLDDGELVTPKSRIIIPKRKLTREEKAANEQVFIDNASPQLPMSTLNSRAKVDINDRLRRFLPLLLAQLTITIFGILCVSAIQTFSDEKTFSIFGLCGMNRKKRLFINLSEYGILMAVSCAVTYIIYFVTKSAGMHAKYGLLFSINNLALSAALIGILLLASITAPFIITRNKRLADQLRRETE